MVQLHVFFLPLLAYGHTIPTVDMAKLFSSRGVKTTIITTSEFAKPIERARGLGFDVGVRCIKFPAAEVGLPEDCTSIDRITSDDMSCRFSKALDMFQEPVEKLVQELNPDCLVADMFFPWANEVAAKHGIPRLIFHGTSFFAMVVGQNMRRYKPFRDVRSDSEPFVVPDLPHQIEFMRTQVSTYEQEDVENDASHFSKLLIKVAESEAGCYGVIVNSFYELEPEYADYYRKVIGRKAWHVGPVSFWTGEKARRGKESSIGEDTCLQWLNGKRLNSVVYLCFGSVAGFTDSQVRNIALGLEASGQDFVWVVSGKGSSTNDEDKGKLFPEGFEERIESNGKGLIIRGWAPQVLILDHEAIGAFVTHCGWNSTLEAVCAGVPMVTWPLHAEQFYNEKLVIEVLKTGVSVGNQKWSEGIYDGVDRTKIANALKRVMESVELRNRANRFKDKARKATEEGGSSYNDLSALIDELNGFRSSRRRATSPVIH